MDCSDVIKGSLCSLEGYCECKPFYAQFNETKCVQGKRSQITPWNIVRIFFVSMYNSFNELKLNGHNQTNKTEPIKKGPGKKTARVYRRHSETKKKSTKITKLFVIMVRGDWFGFGHRPLTSLFLHSNKFRRNHLFRLYLAVVRLYLSLSLCLCCYRQFFYLDNVPWHARVLISGKRFKTNRI